MIKKVFSIIFLIITPLVMLYFTVIPMHVPNGVDKLYHFLGFFALSLVSVWAFAANFGSRHLNVFIFNLMILEGLAGALTEYLQKLTGSRECSPYDWMFNVLGVMTAVGVCYFTNLTLEKMKESELGNR